MKFLDNERIIWQSKNELLLLTTHRLREIHKSSFGSKIKSIMLNELTACELRTIRKFGYLRRAVIYFFVLNLSVYFLNNYLFKAEIFKFFFDEVYIGPDNAALIFYISLTIALLFVIMFFFSVRTVFTFYAGNFEIDFQQRWLSFDERESFLSTVEEAKDRLRKNIYG